MKKAYKWQLRKGSKKERCPACGLPRFVPYVLAADGVTLAGPEYGRCDREQNCGYSRYPSHVDAGSITPQPVKILQPLRFRPAAVVTDYATDLFKYASGLLGVTAALEVWRRYKIGRDGARVVFWQIDRLGEIRAGKSIPYLQNGHRDKTDKFPANWLHKSPRWRESIEGEELQQCFFGEHLLTGYPDANVAIVESEKTAALMSAYTNPAERVWLASGGAQGLKNENKNKALKGRNVLLVPDHGQFWNWYNTAREYGWQITDQIEKHPIFDGCDILDFVTEKGGPFSGAKIWNDEI